MEKHSSVAKPVTWEMACMILYRTFHVTPEPRQGQIGCVSVPDSKIRCCVSEYREHPRILETRKLHMDQHRWTGRRRLHSLQNQSSVQQTYPVAKRRCTDEGTGEGEWYTYSQW